MCGILGGVGVGAQSRAMLHHQLDLINHRGPDEIGTYCSDGISLGVCRLAIVEVTVGKQPVQDNLGDIHVILNGEIYNYKSLKKDIERKGITLRNSSEVEIILNLYRIYGLNFLNKLEGMFAIAIFDSKENCLHLIRDRTGEKPLWVSQVNDKTLFFSSEIKALYPVIKTRTIRLEMIREVMQLGYVLPPQSTFNEIAKLEPATVLTWREGKISTKKYWNINFENKNNIGYSEAVKITKQKILESVKKTLVSERPLGIFLSGGYDSTIVTALAANMYGTNLKTFTLGFEHDKYDESEYARNLSNHFKLDHHEKILKPNPEKIVHEIYARLDQPFADSSIIPTFYLSKFASKHVVVALGGDGADEVFGGYYRYSIAQFLQKYNQLMPLARHISKFLEKSKKSSQFDLKKLSSNLRKFPSLSSRYFSLQSMVSYHEIGDLLDQNSSFDHVFQQFDKKFQQKENISNLARMVDADFSFYLPNDILFKLDSASMLNSVELRSPFLDVELIEWSMTLPDNYKIHNFKSKRILKDIARTLVPNHLINRPKMGFAIPRASWIRGELKTMTYDLLMDKTARDRGWFNPEKVKLVIESHMKGNDMDNIIWPILCLELWARNWLT
jgi:asparagine synthase (glutamine-hydrolysing)